MKKIIALLLFQSIFVLAFAQTQKSITDAYPRFSIAAGGGFVSMHRLPSGVDEQISTAFRLDLRYNLPLADRHYISIGVGYESNRHIVDGFFYKSLSDEYQFDLTPPNFKQHELQMQYINVPVFYKYRWMNTAGINVGPFFGWLIDAQSKYKMFTTKYKEDAPVENKFRWGLQAESEVMTFNKRARGGTIASFGFQYQLSDFLNEGRSFRPFLGYVKLGIAIR